MPLHWDIVRDRYADGAELPSLPGAATLSVKGADDDYVYIKHRLWEDRLSRGHLEHAVELLETGQMVRNAGEFIDQYRTFIADERPTTAATVLKDLGYVN